MRPTYRHPLDPTPRYAFIDGNNYLREWGETMEAVHGNKGRIDFHTMRFELGAQRLHWYDAVLDVGSVYGIDGVAAEERAKAERRASDRRAFLEGVQEEDGFVVRTGTSRGVVDRGRVRPREKEVDVLLAVDSLLHAASGNMKHAVILSGDLDHRPVVEALMQLGVFVTVYGHARAAAEIKLSADSFRPLDYDVLYEWRAKNPKVEKSGRYSGGGLADIDRGVMGDTEMVLELVNDLTYQAYRADEERGSLHCEDKAALLRYIGRYVGKVAWQKGDAATKSP